jgi:hypothetical protein
VHNFLFIIYEAKTETEEKEEEKAAAEEEEKKKKKKKTKKKKKKKKKKQEKSYSDKRSYLRIMFSMAVGRPGTFQGMFAFQQRHASERCCRMVRALLARTPSGIMSRMSCITAARSSRS